MTLLSMYKRDDSRTVYRILAEQAVRYFDHPSPGTESKILLTNLSRLLQRYRYDAFSYDDAPGILEVFKTKGESQGGEYVTTSAKASLEVIPALEAAHARVYQAISREDLVGSLMTLHALLASSTLPDDQDTKQRLAKARLFFETLSEGLKKRNA